jgi:hypothetical protein
MCCIIPQKTSKIKIHNFRTTNISSYTIRTETIVAKQSTIPNAIACIL